MNTSVPIGEASRLTGLPIKTIRFYEEEGVTTPPARTESGRRTYDDRWIRQLRLAASARNLGLPLAVIRELVNNAFAGGCREHVLRANAALEAQLAAVDSRIAELQAARTELQRLAADAVLIAAAVPADQRVDDCPCCLMIEDGSTATCSTQAVNDLRIPAQSLDVLSCEIGSRPPGAPGPFDLLADVLSLERSASSLRLTFRADAETRVAEFVAAEQVCCREITWELETTFPVTLTVTAAPAQLDIIEASFREGSEA
jgi:DNA-binding transcriptional MerR regulator